MQPTILTVFRAFSGSVLSMSSAGLALFGIGLFAARNDIAQSRDVDKIAALTHLCLAIPLAVFGRRTSFQSTVPADLGAIVHAMAYVLGIFRRLCADRRIFKHRH
jgi:hypothetical protein